MDNLVPDWAKEWAVSDEFFKFFIGSFISKVPIIAIIIGALILFSFMLYINHMQPKS